MWLKWKVIAEEIGGRTPPGFFLVSIIVKQGLETFGKKRKSSLLAKSFEPYIYNIWNLKEADKETFTQNGRMYEMVKRAKKS